MGKELREYGIEKYKEGEFCFACKEEVCGNRSKETVEDLGRFGFDVHIWSESADNACYERERGRESGWLFGKCIRDTSNGTTSN
jgi:hypothetical protein